MRSNRATRNAPTIDVDRLWSQWMEAAQGGDRLAYDCLLREIVPYIRLIASRRHRAPDLVDDVVQDVLLTVHRVRHTDDPARPFRRWRASITRGRLIDALRCRCRRATHEVAVDTTGFACESYADPAVDRLGDAYATADHLGRAIHDLPPQQREAIELLRLRELSLAEASKLAGRSIAALKVNAHRAIRSLRNQLQPGARRNGSHKNGAERGCKC